jgi:hypothetical protein
VVEEDEAHAVAYLDVDIGDKPGLVDIEVLRAADLRDGDGDELELPIHARSPFSRLPAQQRVGAFAGSGVLHILPGFRELVRRAAFDAATMRDLSGGLGGPFVGSDL